MSATDFNDWRDFFDNSVKGKRKRPSGGIPPRECSDSSGKGKRSQLLAVSLGSDLALKTSTASQDLPPLPLPRRQLILADPAGYTKMLGNRNQLKKIPSQVVRLFE